VLDLKMCWLLADQKEEHLEKVYLPQYIQSIDGITLDETKMEAGSNYFKVPLFYPQQFHIPDALRPSLQLEFSYTQPRSNAVNCSIHSFVAEFTKSDPETNILCLAPHETASDKLSALVWRVAKRNRQDRNDDPAMIRHLHDLCKLQTEIRDEESTFIDLALKAFDVDMNTGKRRLDKNLYRAALSALVILREGTVGVVDTLVLCKTVIKERFE